MCHMLEHKSTLQFATSSNTVYPRSKWQIKCVVNVVIYRAKVLIPSSQSKMNVLKWNVIALNSSENLVKWPYRCTGCYKHSEKQWWAGSRYMTGNPIVRMDALPLTNQENADCFQWYRRSGATQTSCPRPWGHNISQTVYIKNLQCLWEAVCWKLPHTWLLLPASAFGQCSGPSGPECQGLLGKAQHFSGVTLALPTTFGTLWLIAAPQAEDHTEGEKI
jgi:hypothetical protein